MSKSLVVLGLCAVTSLFAQAPRFSRGRMAPGGRGTGEGVERTVTGAPYSAVRVTESTQTLPNGNVITRQTSTNVYRDSMGRVRTETAVTQRGTGSAETGQPSRTVITIHDPVAGVTHELNPQTKTDREVRLSMNRGRAAAQGGRGNAQPRTNAGGATTNPNVVRESLGMQTVNGVQATGTRVTRTIPAGQIGNAQAIQTVHETWMSPDLKVPVTVRSSDPRSRTTTTQLTNITRSEPDPALFQPPADYTVTKVGFGRRGARASHE
jgi:hypothetical protein